MLIGLTGKAGVGKTTIAKMLEERDGFVIRTYAYPLKKSLCSLTGLPMEYFTDIKLKEIPLDVIGKSPRQLMQLMGTEFVRNLVYKDFWTHRMSQTLRRMDATVNVVIDDCRFENETALVRSLGGKVVHLMRDYGKVTDQTAHASEQMIRSFPQDFMINSGRYTEEFTYKLLQEIL